MDANVIHLVEAIEKRRDLLSESATVDLKKKKVLWAEVLMELKTLGITKFGTDDVASISKRVTNLKYRTKKKAGLINGGGRPVFPLNSVEEKILHLMGYACENGIWHESKNGSASPQREEPSTTHTDTTQDEVKPPPQLQELLLENKQACDKRYRPILPTPSIQVVGQLLENKQASDTILPTPSIQVVERLLENKQASDTILPTPSIQTPTVENEGLSSPPSNISDHLQPSTSKSEEPRTTKFRPFKRKEFKSRFTDLFELEREKLSIKREKLKLENKKIGIFQEILGELRLLNDKVDEFIENKDK